jgi:hypothetical protein
MTDHAKGARKPTPHLQTRPATMLTAIGLCVIIMLIQLVPEFQTMGSMAGSMAGSRIPTSVTASAR